MFINLPVVRFYIGLRVSFELLVEGVPRGLRIEKQCVIYNAVPLRVTVRIYPLPSDLIQEKRWTEQLVENESDATINAIIAMNINAPFRR